MLALSELCERTSKTYENIGRAGRVVAARRSPGWVHGEDTCANVDVVDAQSDAYDTRVLLAASWLDQSEMQG